MSKTFGAYTVIQRLPLDGEAYLAKSAEGGERTLQVVDVPPADERVERVRAETLACAALHHSAVGMIPDIIEHEGQLVVVGPAPIDDGATLAELIERMRSAEQELDRAAVWYIGLQVASAIALAHATEVEGDFIPVCHGHLGPERVTLGRDGSVRVEGLGLARLVGESGFSAPEGYTAPEQVGGGRITPRGDIYSIGAIVWQLLSGEDPHPGMSVADADVPAGFRDAFARALEPKVGQRRITSMELEQIFKELGGGDGKKALVEALELLRRGATLLGHTRPEKQQSSQPPQLGAKRGGKLGGALGGRAPSSSRTPTGPSKLDLPPLRSKQSTLMGAAAPPARQRLDSVPIDWDAASKAASDTISPPAIGVADELSWAAGEDDAGDLVPRQSGGDIVDEDSDDEEMTMMNPAGAELRAAMDQAKKQRSRNVDALRPVAKRGEAKQEEETTLVTSRRKLARGDEKLSALAGAQQDDWDDATVLRDKPKLPVDAAKRRRPVGRSQAARDKPAARKAVTPTPSPSKPVTPTPTAKAVVAKAAARATPSDRGSSPSDAGRRSSTPDALETPEPPRSDRGKRDSGASVATSRSIEDADLNRTLASAGVDDEPVASGPGEPPPATMKAAEPQPEKQPESRPIKNLVIDIGDDEPISSKPATEVADPPAKALEKPKPSPRPEAASQPPVEVEMKLPSKEPAADTAPVSAARSGAAEAGSPWSKDGDELETPGEARTGAKPIPRPLAALIMVVTAVGVMVAGVLWVTRNSTVSAPPSLPSAETSAAPKASATALPPKRAAAPSTKPSASAAPSASAQPEPGALAPPDVDASALPMTLGYLKVMFAGDANGIVSALGKDIGQVGVAHQVACGRPMFIRIKSGEGRWLNGGQTVTVACREVTTIEAKQP